MNNKSFTDVSLKQLIIVEVLIFLAVTILSFIFSDDKATVISIGLATAVAYIPLTLIHAIKLSLTDTMLILRRNGLFQNVNTFYKMSSKYHLHNQLCGQFEISHIQRVQRINHTQVIESPQTLIDVTDYTKAIQITFVEPVFNTKTKTYVKHFVVSLFNPDSFIAEFEKRKNS